MRVCTTNLMDSCVSAKIFIAVINKKIIILLLCISVPSNLFFLYLQQIIMDETSININ